MVQLYEATKKFCTLAGFSSSAQPYFLYHTTAQYYYWIHDINSTTIAQNIPKLLNARRAGDGLITHLSTAILLNNNLIEEYPELFI